ncbi:MAG: hypothetical protein PHU44_15855 [Syntrophales bacterium]|nr:hypothetical protein [Syntrophales bacterium]MDD5641987.1 hypothetical protein [Syntrophales bacterium]
MNGAIDTVIEPLIKKKIFPSAEAAVREIVKEYILRQVTDLNREVSRFERKYGMPLERFREYLHERSLILEQDDLSETQRHKLSQAIMQEEDDCLDWQVAQDFLDNWLGLHEETTA